MRSTLTRSVSKFSEGNTGNTLSMSLMDGNRKSSVQHNRSAFVRQRRTSRGRRVGMRRVT